MYNLLDEPFIKCFYPNGMQKELGIKDTLAEASKISRIGGDSDIHEVIIIRLLLAILYRALPEVEGIPEWENIWNQGLPLEQINQYLEEYRERFELLDSETPFYQILDATYEKSQEPHNKFLVLSHQLYNSSESLYSSFKEKQINKLDFSYAARQLLELQAYNTASRKSIIKGDTRVKKKYYAQAGWLSNGTAIHAIGKNLEDTLLLNFIPYSVLDISYDEDLPVWEREQQTAAPEELHGELDESRKPDGPADLYTHQSSRITLYHNNEYVTGTVTGIGDRLFKYNLSKIEPMMAWREILRETKELAFVPVKQTEGKDSWRSLNAFLGQNNKLKFRQEKPKILTWLNNLEVREIISDKVGNSISTCATTLFYGPQDAIIKEKDVSILDISNDILQAEGIASLNAIKGLQIAENQIYNFSCLIANLLVSEGKEKSPAKGVTSLEIAKTQTYEILRILGSEYQKWINLLTAENAEQQLVLWNKKVYEITKEMGNRYVSNASTSAIAGRVIGENLMNAAVASNIFERTIFKEFKIEREEEENGK